MQWILRIGREVFYCIRLHKYRNSLLARVITVIKFCVQLMAVRSRVRDPMR
jgi:hypothetical protein